MVKMLLNADLGEGEPAARTEALMRVIDLANVACGGHAGTPESMERAVRLALRNGVAVGAHPGLQAEFGRGSGEIAEEDLRRLVLEQSIALADVCGRCGAKLHHVKLHGALYHSVERSDSLARAYVEAVREWSPGLAVVAFVAGRVLPAARAAGVRGLAEVFAERGTRPDGLLVPRGEPGDLIRDPAGVAARLQELRGDTVCVHSDSPNALEIARVVRAAIGPR